MNGPGTTAEHFLLKALQLEADGYFTEAINYYRKAYKLKPELDTKITTFFVDGVEYDENGQMVSNEIVEADRTFKEDFTPLAVVPPKFEANDPNASKYLEENGYVVFTHMATKEQIEEAKKLFWDHVEDFTSVSRDDVSSWSNGNWPGDITNGIVADIGIGQSPFLWYLRTLPNVRKAFAGIWKDDDLLVSFDGCGTFRPVEYKQSWRTKGGWFHIDQNLYSKKGRHCVQGLMNLFHSGEYDGGYVVVPQSHHMMENAFSKYDDLCRMDSGDYYRFTRDIDFWESEKTAGYSHKHALRPIKLCLDPGDFVMWDSRTVHCNHPPTKLSDDPLAITSLKRLVGYICMTPASMATDLNSLIENRVYAFKNGMSTSHWPHEYHPTSGQPTRGVGAESPKIKLTDEDMHLIYSRKLSDVWSSEFKKVVEEQ